MLKNSQLELCELGGKCINCGAEDKWLVLDSHKLTDSRYDYHYDLQCKGEIRHDPIDEMGIGEIETCNHKRDITLCEGPEYQKNDDIE